MAARKYHLKADGTPGICVAQTTDACKAAGSSDGFHGTLEEAQVESERRLSEKHGDVAPAATKKSNAPSTEISRSRRITEAMNRSGGRLEMLATIKREREESREQTSRKVSPLPPSPVLQRNNPEWTPEQEIDFQRNHSGDPVAIKRRADSLKRGSNARMDQLSREAEDRTKLRDAANEATAYAPTDSGMRRYYENEIKSTEAIVKRERISIGDNPTKLDQLRADLLARTHHGGGRVFKTGSDFIIKATLDGHKHAYGPEREGGDLRYLGKLDPRLEGTVQTAAERKELTAGDKPANFLTRLRGTSQSYGRATVTLSDGRKATFATDAKGYPVEKAVWDDIDSSKLPRELFEDESLRKSIANRGVLTDWSAAGLDS